MATQQEILSEIAAKISKQTKNLCCKLDSVIAASGGSPVSYNTVNTQIINPGDVYSSPEAHSIQVTVLQATSSANTADITINGNSLSFPVGINWNQEATTVFAAGTLTVENTSTASVLITTITAS